MKTIDLAIKPELYDQIENGTQTELYREIKPFWCKRLTGFARICHYAMPYKPQERICQLTGYPCKSTIDAGFDKVKIRRGVTKQSMTFEVEYLKIDFGKTEWGAPLNEKVFILILGNRIDD